MTVRRLMLILAVVFGGQSVSADVELQLHVDAAHNLRYQLDCLSGYTRCTRQSIVLGGLPLSDADQVLLGVWRALRRADAPDPRPARRIPELRLPTPAALAHVSSRNAAPASAPAPAPSQPRHRRQLQQSLIDYFFPRFESEWQRSQRPHLERLRYNLLQLSANNEFADQLSSAAALFGQQALALPEFHLVAVGSAAHGSLATLDSQKAFVESPLGERAEDRLPVIVHEIVHHWLAGMDDEQQLAVVDAFMQQTDACAIPSYHLFEESLAAAIGNGYFERLVMEARHFPDYLALPASFYADSDIDSLAKAALPLVSRYIGESMPIDAAFVDAWVALASATLGERCDALPAQLRTTAFVLTDGALATAQGVVQQRLGSTTTFTDVIGDTAPAGLVLSNYPALSGIVVTTRGRLAALNGLLPTVVADDIHALAEQHDRVVYGWRRSMHSTVYVVVGSDLANSEAALLQFAALTVTRFSGAWIPPSLPSPAS